MKQSLHGWYVYIVECGDGTYYCGMSNDVSRRVEQHNSGRGAKYTRGRGPVKLLCAVNFPSRSAALRAEHKVKKKPKSIKISYLKQLKDYDQKVV